MAGAGSHDGSRSARAAMSGRDVSKILPEECNRAFVDGIECFGRQIKGFDRPDAVLLGVESRTSSPVRDRARRDPAV